MTAVTRARPGMRVARDAVSLLDRAFSVPEPEEMIVTFATDSPAALASQLRAQIDGRVVEPDDADFDSLRTVANGAIDARPLLIARPVNDGDVASIIAAARESGLPLAVRSGGHSGAGHGVVEGGIVLDLRDMRALDIDVDARTVWAETGLTAAEYSAALGEHGLATGFGDTGSVGIGGITLGGGIGYLVRKYGLTIDDLLAADIVTADGEVRRVDEANEPDLFWAIRGGGGNFGVATRFKFRAHPLPAVVGGMLFLPGTADVLTGFLAAAAAAPEELSTIANVMPCPPMPFVPAELHGSVVLMALMGYAGTAEAGQLALAPFRALAEPIADLVRPMTYPELFPPEEDFHPKYVNHTMFVNHVDHALAQTIIDKLEASDATMRVAQLRVLGGAMARVPVDATAFAHRRSKILVTVAAFYEGDDLPIRQQWVAELAAALQQGDTGSYVNFIAGEGAELVRAAYPGRTFDRLAEIKARYDPTNLFQRNQNIPPAGGGRA